jgi:hypothetical protein
MPQYPVVPGSGDIEDHRGHGMQLAFQWHARVFVLVNAFLIAIWAITSGFGYFWPVWPLLGWGLGLGVHAVATFSFPGKD